MKTFSKDDLRGRTPQELFPGARAPEAAVAGAWLALGDLDAAHKAAQEIETPEGSFWHAILHRREPDPANSAYWFRRTGRHPVFPALRERVAALLDEFADVRFALKDEWDPYAFIDFYETARRRPGSRERELSDAIEQIEWELLFEYCTRPSE
jgi:hypothetical protein